MKLSEVKSKLGKNVFKLANGNFIVRQGYFYRMGKNEELLKQKVLQAFPSSTIVRAFDHFAAFRGGAPLSKQSHFGVEFNFNPQPK